MQVLYPRCAGLDVHKDTVVACVRCVSLPVQRETRSFPTTTSGLLALVILVDDGNRKGLEKVHALPPWQTGSDPCHATLSSRTQINSP